MMWLRTAYIAIVLLIVTLILLPLQLLGLAFDWRLRRRIPRIWHRIACHVLGIRVHVHGEVERAKPLMLAVNHASWKDILVLGSIADVVFIAKTEVRDWPVFGWLARLQKSIFVQREQKRSTGQQVGEIASRMADGEIVVLFPEGTTSDGNRMLAVKSSLFGAASTAAEQVPANWFTCSPSPSPIRGCRAWPWAATIGSLPPGRAASRWCRICSVSSRRARLMST